MVAACQAQHRLGSENVGLYGLDRIPDDEIDAHRRREVVDHVAVIDESVHHARVRDRPVDESKLGTLDQMGDVLETSRGEIVHGGDRRAVGEEMFREMAPDESRASRDQDPHGPGETHRGFVSVSVSVPAAIPVPIRVHRFLSFHIGSV